MRLKEVRPPTSQHTPPHHYGPSTIVEWGNDSWILSRGLSDTTWFFKDDEGSLHVLTLNYSLGYVGLEVLDPRYPGNLHHVDEDGNEIFEPTDSIFLQDPDDGWSGLPQPKPWLDYQPRTIVRKLTKEFIYAR